MLLPALLGCVGCGGGETRSNTIAIKLSHHTALKPDLVISPIELGYYQIRGNDADALNQQMIRLGPNGDDPKRERRAGTATWWISWRPVGECPKSQYRVHLITSYTLPRWTPPPSATIKLRARWRRFLANLRTHLDGHRQLAINAAVEIHSALNALPPQPCHSLRARALSAARLILARYRAAERNYDRTTNYGETQKAQL